MHLKEVQSNMKETQKMIDENEQLKKTLDSMKETSKIIEENK